MTTFPIVGPVDGGVLDPVWGDDVTNATNDHETRIGTLEVYTQILSTYKTIDENYASTTFHSDADLNMACAPNSVYSVEMNCIYETSAGGATPGMKVQFSIPPSSTYKNGSFLAQVSAVTTYSFTNANGNVVGLTGGSTSAGLPLRLTGLLVTGASAGNLIFQWACNGAGTLNMHAGTTMTIQKIR